MSGYSSVHEDRLASLPIGRPLLPRSLAPGAVLGTLARVLARFAPVERVAVVGCDAACAGQPPPRWRGRRSVELRVDAARRNDAVALAASGSIDRVLIALDPAETAARAAILAALRPVDVAVDLLDDAFDIKPLRRRAIGGVGRCCKAVFDRIGAALLLGLLGPAMGLIALAIRFGDGGPVLFRQAREGLHGRTFSILKFRTMRLEFCCGTGPVVQTTRRDDRVTPVGRLLRATSLDELPQLVNVLRGDMSLVGPRPHPKLMLTERRTSDEIAPEYAGRHRVRPGMTGWAQVNGSRGGLATADALRRRLSLDLDYIDRWSLLLDLRIILLTPLRLLFHGGTAF